MMTSGSFERRMVTNTASNMILTQRHMTGCFFHLRRSDLIQSFWIIEKPGLKSAGHTHVFLSLRVLSAEKTKTHGCICWILDCCQSRKGEILDPKWSDHGRTQVSPCVWSLYVFIYLRVKLTLFVYPFTFFILSCLCVSSLLLLCRWS